PDPDAWFGRHHGAGLPAGTDRRCARRAIPRRAIVADGMDRACLRRHRCRRDDDPGAEREAGGRITSQARDAPSRTGLCRAPGDAVVRRRGASSAKARRGRLRAEACAAADVRRYHHVGRRTVGQGGQGGRHHFRLRFLGPNLAGWPGRRFRRAAKTARFPRIQQVPHGPDNVVYCGRLEPGLDNMTSELPPNSPTTRSFSLSIGQLTFGSFLAVLAVIIITSTASVIAIRHIDSTFAELQRLQSVCDLAEDIDRRMNELRLAARDFVTDPGAGTQFKQVGEAASTLNDILRKTRIELAPEQQDMIDGVTERLATYRSGLERISTL